MSSNQSILIQTGRIQLNAYPRGYHIITPALLDALTPLPEQGMLFLHLLHTSAAITINEAADPDVLYDFETYLNMIVPEQIQGLRHTVEGPDDMPAHIKAALIGTQLTIPIEGQSLLLGTWQGVYLCEFRNRARSRTIAWTLYT